VIAFQARQGSLTGGRPGADRWLGCLAGGVFAVALALQLRSRIDVEEILIVAGWLVIGVALSLGPHRAGAWLLAAALGVTTALQLVRLRDFLSPLRFPPEDFAIVFESARRLYRAGLDPYLDPRANSFPFPAYAIFDGVGLWGRLNADDASRLFLVLNIAALMIGLVAVRASTCRALRCQSGASTLLVLLAVVSHPGVVQALLFGQTGVLVMLWVALGIWAWQCRPSPWLAAVFFSLAWMQKPYLVMAALFFVACLIRDVVSGRRVSHEGRIGGALGIVSTGAILGILLWPGGVTLQTFIQFIGGLRRLEEIYSRLWAENYSVVAVGLHAGLRVWDFDYGTLVHVASVGLFVLVAAFSVVLLDGAKQPLFAGLAWVAASLIPFSIVYKHYYPWLIPALYPLLVSAFERRLEKTTIWLVCGATAMLHVLTSPVFTAGVMMLLLGSQLAAREPRSIGATP
jgi:hypothetical protein